jgi:hypothetical protein
MFSPSSSTQTLTVGASSVSCPIDPSDSVVSLLAVGNAVVFVRIGAGPQTATATDYPILQNVPTVIPAYSGADTLAAISSSAGTETLYVTTGHDV